jgi:hypothetical protein
VVRQVSVHEVPGTCIVSGGVYDGDCENLRGGGYWVIS